MGCVSDAELVRWARLMDAWWEFGPHSTEESLALTHAIRTHLAGGYALDEPDVEDVVEAASLLREFGPSDAIRDAASAFLTALEREKRVGDGHGN